MTVSHSPVSLHPCTACTACTASTPAAPPALHCTEHWIEKEEKKMSGFPSSSSIASSSAASSSSSHEARRVPSNCQRFSSDGYHVRLNCLWHHEISPRQHAYLQRYKGVVYFHLREFEIDEQGLALLPSKKGLCLNRQQVADLLAEIEDLLDIVGEVSVLLS